MKKILISMLAIAITIGAVTSSAYALFSDTVKVAGVTITSGNADLELYDGGTDIKLQSFVSALNTSGALKNLYPGFKDYTEIDFENKSTADINLNLKGQLTAASGDWGYLKDKIWIAVSKDGDENHFPTSGWKTLAEWNTQPISFGTALGKTREKYNFFIVVSESAGNEIASKGIYNVTFEFTGTQKQ
jgi:hypothetical protein